MNTDRRREAIGLLAEMLDLAPEIRIGQMVAFLGYLGENLVNRGLWDLEDDELLTIMQTHREELRARLQATAENPVDDAAVTPA